MLVDVVVLVGRGEHLALIDIVHADGLQDLRLDEVADAALGHDRDADGGHDRADQARVGHARHPALNADVGRNPLERHDRHGPGLLGDHGMFGRDHVHDDAPLEHLRQPAFDREAGGSLCFPA
jgi:hypothetical protein